MRCRPRIGRSFAIARSTTVRAAAGRTRPASPRHRATWSGRAPARPDARNIAQITYRGSIVMTPIETHTTVQISDADVRHRFRTICAMRGQDMLTAATGAEGIETAIQRGPAVVLIDLTLPDMPGYEVCRRLRAKLGRGVRLVAVSASGHPFDGHLVTPVELKTLASALGE